MKKVALENVTPLPVDYPLTTVRETSVIGLVVYHTIYGKGIVVAKARDSWIISFEKEEYSGDYSPIVCYKRNLLRCSNPGFDNYMSDYISFYS